MMKHTRKTLSRLAAMFLSVMLLAALAIVPASAAEGDTLNVNEAGNTITFNKVVDMTNAEGAGNPVGNFVFTVTDGTGDASAQIVDEDNGTDGVQIVAPLTSGTSVGVDIAFNMTAFTAPGVYTYTLRETSSSIDGMVIDGTQYTLSVVVVNANASDPDGTTYKIDSAEIKTADGKTDTITNSYYTYDLTLDKVVTGAFGNHNEDFTFTVVFTTNDDNATSFQWAYTSANPTWTDVSFENGTATVTPTLSDGESVMFKGLPQGTTYTITEGTNDYTTTATGTGVDEYADKVVEGDFVVNSAYSDVAVTYTNTLEASPATGIITTFAPYALMVVVAAGACFFFLRRRNAAED